MKFKRLGGKCLSTPHGDAGAQATPICDAALTNMPPIRKGKRVSRICRLAFNRPPLKVVYISFHLHFFGHNFIWPLSKCKRAGKCGWKLGKNRKGDW